MHPPPSLIIIMQLFHCYPQTLQQRLLPLAEMLPLRIPDERFSVGQFGVVW